MVRNTSSSHKCCCPPWNCQVFIQLHQGQILRPEGLLQGVLEWVVLEEMLTAHQSAVAGAYFPLSYFCLLEQVCVQSVVPAALMFLAWEGWQGQLCSACSSYQIYCVLGVLASILLHEGLDSCFGVLINLLSLTWLLGSCTSKKNGVWCLYSTVLSCHLFSIVNAQSP